MCGAVAVRLHTCVATLQKWGLMLPSCQRAAEGRSCTLQLTAEANWQAQGVSTPSPAAQSALKHAEPSCWVAAMCGWSYWRVWLPSTAGSSSWHSSGCSQHRHAGGSCRLVGQVNPLTPCFASGRADMRVKAEALRGVCPALPCCGAALQRYCLTTACQQGLSSGLACPALLCCAHTAV